MQGLFICCLNPCHLFTKKENCLLLLFYIYYIILYKLVG